MRIIIATNAEPFVIGKVGENLAAKVLFPVVGEWLGKYGSGTFRLFFKRPNDSESYLVSTTTDNENVIWNVTNTELAQAGTGVCELNYVSGTKVVKSATYTCKISEGIAPEGATPPAAWTSWVNEILEAAETIEEGIDDLDDRMDSIESVTPDEASSSNKLADKNYVNTLANGKLSEPSGNMAVGQYFRIASIDGDGHPVLEAVDLPVANGSNYGTVKADAAQETDTQPVRIGADGKLVTLPGAPSIHFYKHELYVSPNDDNVGYFTFVSTSATPITLGQQGSVTINPIGLGNVDYASYDEGEEIDRDHRGAFYQLQMTSDAPHNEWLLNVYGSILTEEDGVIGASSSLELLYSDSLGLSDEVTEV